MSKRGWQDFLGAEGIDDWVVLHGGATAVFRVRSLSEAARLAEAVAKVPDLEGSGVLLTIGDADLTVRLSRDLWQLEPRHVELARAMHLDVSVAREHVTARLQAALAAAGGRIVDESHAPSNWTLADRAGNRVCLCAWPDESTRKPPDGPA